MDHAPTVRKALYQACGSWMVDLKDRYSFWHKLLTLMLNGANDEIPELQVLCTELFHAAGKKWEKENEDDLKDFLDFGNTDPDRLPLGYVAMRSNILVSLQTVWFSSWDGLDANL